MSENPNVFAVTAASFDELVIAGSSRRPILVDFWAAWCGPCRALAPVLEQLAEAHQGRLGVAKIDSDAEPDLAGRYGIRSLPTLLLFKDGAPVSQIVGAQPLGALNAFVEPYLPRASDRARELAAAARAAGDGARALALLEAAFSDDPGNPKLPAELAELLIDAGELDRAEAVLRTLPVNRADAPEVRRQEIRLRMLRAAPGTADPGTGVGGGESPPPAESGTDARYQWAIGRALAGDAGAALSALIEIVRTDRRYGDDAARKAMLDIFALQPEDSPLVREYRTALARTLH
ncbi:MAG: thioredoxin [Gammaproteobacteria bacterium]